MHRPLSRGLRIGSLVVLLLTLGLWLGTGAHAGWTRTSVIEMHHDEITGIDYPEERSGLVVGLDALAVGLFLSTVLGLTAVLPGRRGPRVRPG